MQSAQNPFVDEGVVAVFGRRAHGEWLPEDLFRLRNLMFMSLSVCLLAFAPLVLITWHFSVARTRGLASLILGLGSLVYLLYARPASQRLRRDRPGLMPTWGSGGLHRCIDRGRGSPASECRRSVLRPRSRAQSCRFAGAALHRCHAVRVSRGQAVGLGGKLTSELRSQQQRELFIDSPGVGRRAHLRNTMRFDSRMSASM